MEARVASTVTLEAQVGIRAANTAILDAHTSARLSTEATLTHEQTLRVANRTQLDAKVAPRLASSVVFEGASTRRVASLVTLNRQGTPRLASLVLFEANRQARLASIVGLVGVSAPTLTTIQPQQASMFGGVPFTLAGVNITDVTRDDPMHPDFNHALWSFSSSNGSVSHSTLSVGPIANSFAMLSSRRTYASGDVEISYESGDDFATDPAMTNVVIAGLEAYVDVNNFVSIQRESNNSFYGSQLSVTHVKNSLRIPAGTRAVTGSSGVLRLAWIGSLVFAYHNDVLIYAGDQMPAGNVTVKIYVNNGTTTRTITTTISDYHSRTGVLFDQTHVVDAQGVTLNRVIGTIPPAAVTKVAQISAFNYNPVVGTTSFTYLDPPTEVILAANGARELILFKS